MSKKVNFHRFLPQLLPFFVVLLLLSSCNKYVLYSHNSPSDKSANNKKVADHDSDRVEKVLKPDDKISISIWNHEDLSVGSVHNIYNVQEETGKWLMIDSKGEVSLPQVGIVKLEGLTVLQAKDLLEKTYSKYVTNPIVNLRVLNNQVTIIGEVQRPGNYIYSSDNILLVDLIGKASGFTDYSKTTNVKIIRAKEVFIIDMTNTAFSETKIYPGDVVYIPPAGGKKFDRFAAKLIPIASLITAIALIYNVTKD